MVIMELMPPMPLMPLMLLLPLLPLSWGFLNWGPRWMWILLSSVVIIFVLELHFLIAEGADCFSGVTLKTARPPGVSRGSCDGAPTVSASGEVLTVMIDTGERGLSESEPLPPSGPLALEMVVMVTGDLALSGPHAPSPAFVFGGTVVGLGTMVMRGFWRPNVGMMVVLEKKSSARGLVISSVAVLF